MARPCKEGLDFFLLECHFDEKVELIQAEFGLKGLAVVVLLFQQIYGEKGYYTTWDEERSLLFAAKASASGDINLIKEIVAACIRRNIFSKELFQKYGILTSTGIQKRYLNATARRGKVTMKKEYLLVEVRKNASSDDRNLINVDNNSINVDQNTHRIEENSILNHCPNSLDENAENVILNPELKSKVDHNRLSQDFEIIYAIYPKKVGRTVAYANYKTWVTTGKKLAGRTIRLTNRQIYKAVRNYVNQQREAGHDDLQYWKNFDTLMGRQLLDYVDDLEG